ncbi:GspE/PulE family protein [Mechercharimyces sp. CAU 1602]|uniref:GspE/PulE family protein n=1 Tax=Mechercharimyces sp. CAU 1602 TaxID=2973933 RepID=UPI002161B15E|nr:GspE/PulE family protein [Mechercharimyces sp. CAU 1602]MCS1350542.1 GspE/PulE family protein [Mechercharimyces sp. CAU 1602]
MDIISFMDEMITEAVLMDASDIHLEPMRDGLRIRQRVDGLLMEVTRISRSEGQAVISRLKVMGELDIGEKRLPQDGACKLLITGRVDKVDIRLSTMPTVFGEKVVLRLLHSRAHSIRLTDLGLEPLQRKRLHRLITQPHGLIVVTGPTGSGKTSTLYALLQELNQTKVNIVTLEDPIECQLDGINQVQIRPKAGLTFSSGLRALLRQDPNVMMVGEIRDQETAEIALRAALTGHLVLTTLHTVDTCSAITRFLDMNIAPYRVAAALSGVVAQRLVRLLCTICKGEGCTSCHQVGYRGRKGIFEVLSITEHWQRMIVQTSSLSQFRERLREERIATLAEIGQARVKAEEIDLHEFHRVVEAFA